MEFIDGQGLGQGQVGLGEGVNAGEGATGLEGTPNQTGEGVNAGEGGGEGAAATAPKIDIGELFRSAGASTGDGNNLMDNFLPDYDFDGNKEAFEGFVDSETGVNYATFLKSEAFKAGAKTKEEMDLFVRGASALAQNLNLFNDEPVETQIQRALLAYPKERQGNLSAVWNRATGTLDEQEIKMFQEEIATDPKLLLIVDKMLGNSVQLNKVYGGANAKTGGASGKYTIEQYRKDVRDDRYYTDANFRDSVNAKAKKYGL